MEKVYEISYVKKQTKSIISFGYCLQQWCNSATQWLLGQTTPSTLPTQCSVSYSYIFRRLKICLRKD